MSILAAAVFGLALQVPSPIVTIARDTMSQVESPRQLVARTQAEWVALWRDHAGGTPPPVVDLSARTVVAVFLGSRSTGGYAVEITGTRQQGPALVVQWRERRPAPDQVSAQVITSPAHIVSIPHFAGEIRFEKADK